MRIICLVLVLLAALYGAFRLGVLFYSKSHATYPFFDETASVKLNADLLRKSLYAVSAADRDIAAHSIGKLFGAQILFNPQGVHSYPFGSPVGEKLDAALRDAFYRGVGSGFAETLCRYWRRLASPDSVTCDVYARSLEIDWQRCISLMEQLPAESSDLIWEGFLAELEERDLNESIRAFITRQLSMRQQ